MHVEVVLRHGQGKSSTTFSNPSHTPDPLAPAPIDSQPSLAKYDFRFVTPTVSVRVVSLTGETLEPQD